MNSKRLDEALKGTKFFKRLLQFFLPQDVKFSSIPASKDNTRYVHIGCLLMKTLVACSEGVTCLLENSLFLQISDGFAQLDPVVSASLSIGSEILFSKDRVSKTLTYGYFNMIGTLTETKEGMR